jgi:hypothetical protein
VRRNLKKNMIKVLIHASNKHLEHSLYKFCIIGGLL